MRLKHSDVIAAWVIAALLVAMIAGAPWDNLPDGVPPGVVDLAQQRFIVGADETAASVPLHAPHHEESRFVAHAPEDL